MDETQSGRDGAGRFASGNSGGPGRPRRAVEADYLAALGDALTLESWRDIVKGAITAAKSGDDKARAWLSKYALGESSISMYELARREALEFSIDDRLVAEVEIAMGEVSGKYGDALERLLDNSTPTPLGLTLQKRIQAEQSAADEREQRERAARRAARKAKVE